MATIRVIIVDDQDVVRRGLTLFLQAFDNLMPVGEASNGAEALRRCVETQADIVLMDMMMPVMDGITATGLIRQQFPHTQVIALTSYHDEATHQAVMRAGAAACLLKNGSIDELAHAITVIASAHVASH
ncbi:MAG: response regulator transcription factor [Chloroflexi bacterium]|nr:response regulator transcription factor [Chloroflexota bacterium]